MALGVSGVAGRRHPGKPSVPHQRRYRVDRPLSTVPLPDRVGPARSLSWSGWHGSSRIEFLLRRKIPVAWRRPAAVLTRIRTARVGVGLRQRPSIENLRLRSRRCADGHHRNDDREMSAYERLTIHGTPPTNDLDEAADPARPLHSRAAAQRSHRRLISTPLTLAFSSNPMLRPRSSRITPFAFCSRMTDPPPATVTPVPTAEYAPVMSDACWRL
jgi:hypothetical protein